MYKLSNYVIFTPPVANLSEPDPVRILYATRSGSAMLLKDSICQKLINAQFSDLHDSTLFELIKLQAIVPQEQHEFDEILQENQAMVADSNTLSLVLQPTANCQLDCHYCGQVHKKKNIASDTSDRLVQHCLQKMRNGNFQRVAVKWYGGEPLMAYGEILRISQQLRNYCHEHDMKYRASMITNGMSFKPNVFIKLLQQDIVHFQITLDGEQETHDVMRITKEGEPSFAIIFNNILAVTSTPEYQNSTASILVRMNINRFTAGGVRKLIDRMAAHGLHERRVKIDFAGVVNWGDNQARKEAFERDEFANLEIEWIMYAQKKGFLFEGLTPKRALAPCMVVNPNAEVYDADGNIYPCYEFPYTPKYESEQYRLGHIDATPPIQNPQALTRNWFEDVKTDIATCRNCNLFPVCGGGCPKQWYDGDVACPSFKQNIVERLALEYMTKRKKKDARPLPQMETV